MERLNYSLLREFDYLFKFIVIGDAAVGKSAILLKYTGHRFEDSYICTIGVDFKIKTIDVNGKKAKLQIWDTAGQERFKPITNCYFRGSHGCVVVFDICNRASFNSIQGWVKSYQEQNFEDARHNIILVGNKADRQQNRSVSKKEAASLAQLVGCDYIEISAKTGENLNEAFDLLTTLVISGQRSEISTECSTLQPTVKKPTCCLS